MSRNNADPMGISTKYSPPEDHVEADYVLTLYNNKNLSYVIGMYETVGEMLEQSSNGYDAWMCKDNEGFYILEALRKTYIRTPKKK